MKLVADISSYQLDTIDFFKSLKAKKVAAVIVKITQGSADGDNYVNPKAKSQIANAKKCGLKVHGYHYAKFTSKIDAQNEAKFFVKTMKKLGLGTDSVAVVDIEDSALPKGNLTACINAFNAMVVKLGYKRTDTYSMASFFWSGRIKPAVLKPKQNLWVANYGSDRPGLDNVGTWQFTDKFKGMNLDMSYDFKGWYTK